jgi:hypothetical protein
VTEEAETPRDGRVTITQLAGHRLPVSGEDWPGRPFHGRWVEASVSVVGAVNVAAAFLDSGIVGNLAVWAGSTDTETGEMWRVWGLADRPVSASYYEDRDDPGVHAVFVPAEPARGGPAGG